MRVVDFVPSIPAEALSTAGVTKRGASETGAGGERGLDVLLGCERKREEERRRGEYELSGCGLFGHDRNGCVKDG